MLIRLLLLFTTVPLLEFWLLWELAHQTNLMTTVVVVVATGVVGTLLARFQGWRTLVSIRDALSHGELPTNAIWDAAMIFCAGALLLTPGLITDTFGLTLLIPFCRRAYQVWASAWFRRNFQVQNLGSGDHTESKRSEVIDVQIRDDSHDRPGS